MRKFLHWAWHPFLTALYPIVFLMSINAGQLPLQYASRALLVALAAALLLMLVFGLAYKDARRGALLTSVTLALFFSYGHINNGLAENAPQLADKTALKVVFGMLLLAGAWGAYKLRALEVTTKYLNLFVLLLLLQPVFNLTLYLYNSGVPRTIDPPSPFDNLPSAAADAQQLPDIYYIILDGHGRTDVVNEIFGYDNSAFTTGLEERGFYVADQSRSNYVQTMLSVASSLNFNYLNLEDTGLTSIDRNPLGDLVNHNELRRFLEGQGYQTVTFFTGYHTTTITDADIVISYQPDRLFNEFEELLLTTSLVSAFSGNKHLQSFLGSSTCDTRRGYTLNIYENLKRIPELPGSKFIFAHILSPHPPFVFDAEGNPVERGGCRVNDGEYFTGTYADYMLGYPEQLAFTDKMIAEVVDAILAKSKIPPVIIIQGDHGSGMLLKWDSAKKTCKRERTAILNAYYIPGGKYDQFYETITPVNSFRVTLNAVFGLDLPLLEDRSYYSGWYTPYQTVDITDRIEDACKLPKW